MHGESHSLSVVAHRRCDHTSGFYVFYVGEDLAGGAADLEGSAELQALKLQIDL